jgi:hypothetical protein
MSSYKYLNWRERLEEFDFDLDLSIKTIAYIYIIGLLSSLLLTFMIYTIIMRYTTLTATELMENEAMYLFILTILELIAFVSSILVSILMARFSDEYLDKWLLMASSLIGFLLHLLFIVMMSYSLLYFFYPSLASKVFYSVPSVFAYFSIFVLNNPFGIMILSILLYFSCFILTLNYLN